MIYPIHQNLSTLLHLHYDHSESRCIYLDANPLYSFPCQLISISCRTWPVCGDGVCAGEHLVCWSSAGLASVAKALPLFGQTESFFGLFVIYCLASYQRANKESTNKHNKQGQQADH